MYLLFGVHLPFNTLTSGRFEKISSLGAGSAYTSDYFAYDRPFLEVIARYDGRNFDVFS